MTIPHHHNTENRNESKQVRVSKKIQKKTTTTIKFTRKIIIKTNTKRHFIEQRAEKIATTNIIKYIHKNKEQNISRKTMLKSLNPLKTPRVESIINHCPTYHQNITPLKDLKICNKQQNKLQEKKVSILCLKKTYK